jgi:hypothetical protein
MGTQWQNLDCEDDCSDLEERLSDAFNRENVMRDTAEILARLKLQAAAQPGVPREVGPSE